MAAGRSGSGLPTLESPPMAYTVLARRYRSQDFGQVVGQEPIAQTLQNALSPRSAAGLAGAR